MGHKLNNRIENWKKLLLDLGKRNRLINLIEGKRNSIKITNPSCEELWECIVIKEREAIFPYAKRVKIDNDGEEIYETVIKGDIETTKSIGDLQKTLKNLRYKANTSIEEQGINTLYLTFGVLKWKEQETSSQQFSSPIILVPVRLLIESMTSPYRLVLHDDEIVINPTLIHKLNTNFGINLPEFDSIQDTPKKYFEKISSEIENIGWDLEEIIYLTNLSFLKINMYNDLSRNDEKLNTNSVIAAIVGDDDPIQLPEELNNFDHDKLIRPIDTYQVVDADSSQQDAMILSKKGISFVLQGPPGTGKSQTITNIIAEAIADGKKILFVSEKMAAIQVVYNRLASVGLADFCLTLHSHKANKKEILRNLEKSIKIERTRVREDVLDKLYLLERKREQLNDYSNELHTLTSKLNISIYSVNGKLAKLKNAPDIIFSISDVDSITDDILKERIYLLKELSKTIGKRTEDYVNNVWYNSNIKSLSHELRHEIDSNIEIAIPLLENLSRQHDSICSKLRINIESSLNGIYDLLSILSFVAKSPIIPIEWINNHDIDYLLDNVHKYKEKAEQIIKITNELKASYKDCFFDCDAIKEKEELSSLMSKLLERFRVGDSKYISKNINTEKDKLISITNELDRLFNEANRIATELRLSSPNTISQIILFLKCINTLSDICNIHPTKKWFDKDELIRIKNNINNHKTLHDTTSELKNSILSGFDKEILELEFYPILKRFRSEYNSCFRILKSKYYKDIKQLKSYLSINGKLSHDDALRLLEKLKKYSDNQKIIDENKSEYIGDYGFYYTDLDTQWNILYNDLCIFEKSLSCLYLNAPEFLDLIVQGQLPQDDVTQFNKNFSNFDIESEFAKLSTILRCNFNNAQWNDIKEYIQEFSSIANDFISKYGILFGMMKTYTYREYQSIIDDLNLLISLNTLNHELQEQNDSICNMYKNHYNGIETDWSKLIENLRYASELKKIIAKFEFPESFVKDICQNRDVISYCQNEAQTMLNRKGNLENAITWFVSLFKNGNDFYQYNILDLAKHMLFCKDNKHLLEEWVDYCSNREKCKLHGLEEYIDKIEDLENPIDSTYIVDAYLKRFYRLWLDIVLPKFPAVHNFRNRNQIEIINDFCRLDKEQFKIAQARVRERAINRIPDFNSINSARDEINILKKELNKQRKLMPLRKLFITIPNLITSLRPCFMMSPLSVSIFLEAKSYNFDLVIFDEASQVHTEDAIGAIMRGKQVIIVGDTKQLPPTNFFSTSINDDDFDNDSDEISVDIEPGTFESILAEAETVLPQCSLKWHYRSRHEHLITFSNMKIYNHELVTFPSPTDGIPDNGVEYVYVKDGVYDRGKKKNNIIEAQKVADLVFEHFRKYPNRSLGVVTFSEAQQNAVDSAIRQKRLQNPYYDNFFIEDKEEAFFIKNLENVQGDERDTIILSIGYAKDSDGIMYMNFGPLNRDGGYRRLNVAITRAKHNVKLVGSIMPTDINLEKTASEGVKMLRSYIEFAQQGIVALQKELSFNSELNFDSPFEEEVYDFLQSKGYNIVTQVGCSGFRIDMAIKHPNQNGIFALGIECDGATYHSSRTARERDRLRQSILESMGWKIYRIWSTDWIKDQKTEEDKLIKAIEQSLGNIEEDNDSIIDNISGNDDIVISSYEIEEKIEISEITNVEYKFETYCRYKLTNDIYDADGNIKRISDIRDKSDIIFDIISLEQPIHFEELCRRIMPLYGRERVTKVVRDGVNSILINELNNSVSIDDNFVKMKIFNEVKVRVKDPNDYYIRSIEYICNEELALAMKTIAQNSFGITPNDLFIATAKLFGFKKIGENIECSLRKVYNLMLNRKEIMEIDGKVNTN